MKSNALAEMPPSSGLPRVNAPLAGWPSSLEAVPPITKFEFGYISTRLFPVSLVQRLPDASNAIPLGRQSVLAVGRPPELHVEPLVKVDWPRATVADSPVEKGVGYFRMRPNSGSETQRLPPESIATPP